MRVLFRLICPWLMIALPGAAWSLDNLLVLYPRVGLNPAGAETSVPLTKIARVIADDGVRSGLEALSVPMSSFIGQSQVSSRELGLQLQRIPELRDFKILGPETVLIELRAATVGVERMLEEAATALRQHVLGSWPTQYRNLEFTFVGQPQRLPVYADSRWSFDLSDLSSLRRRVALWVEIDNGRRAQRVPLWFQVSGEVVVWRSIQSLPPRTPVDGFQFVPDWADIAAVDSSNLAAPMENYRLTGALKSGDILTDRHLEKIPAVDFGDEVRVILLSGNIELITEAKAMRTAHAGDRINFQSLSSGEEFEAQVIARNLARVGGESNRGEEAYER